MKVDIRQETVKRELLRTGMLASFKKPEYETLFRVHANVAFSDEERSIIDKFNLGDTVVWKTAFYSRPDELKKWPLLASQQGEEVRITVKEVLEHGIGETFLTPVDAQNFAHSLQTEILPRLKGFIEASKGADKPTTSSFEL